MPQDHNYITFPTIPKRASQQSILGLMRFDNNSPALGDHRERTVLLNYC